MLKRKTKPSTKRPSKKRPSAKRGTAPRRGASTKRDNVKGTVPTSTELNLDGGLVALAGFLYQILGGASTFAAIHKVRSVSGRGDNIEAVIRLEHESKGQDFNSVQSTTSGGRKRVLYQYKFSIDPENHPIRPAELKKIFTTLKASEISVGNEVDDNGSKHFPVRLVLRTNRGLSPRCEHAPELQDIEYELFEKSDALNALRSYAAEFGVYEAAAFRAGVNQCVGRLINLGASLTDHELRIEDFNEDLVGHTSPERITVSTLAPKNNLELQEQKDIRLGIEASDYLVIRPALVRSLSECIDDALIVLTGKGGYGKSVVLWQTIHEATHRSERLGKLCSYGDTEKITLGRIVEQWRRNGYGSTAVVPDDVALEMLKRANAGIDPPILLVALDGADEMNSTPSWRETVAGLIDFFWRIHKKHENTGTPPLARLLVTCRSEKEVEKFLQPVSGLGIRDLKPTYIPVGEFSDEELRLVIRGSTNLSQAVSTRLLEAIELFHFAFGAGNREQLQGLAVSPVTSTKALLPVEADLLSLLRQPILWRCFSLLPATSQIGVLNQATELWDTCKGQEL